LRIYIKLNGRRGLKVLAPIGLIKGVLSFGGFGLSVAKKYIPQEHRGYVEGIDFKELRKGFDELKAYKGLKLVEVKTGDGTEVTVVV
jgi:hypothetical protein